MSRRYNKYYIDTKISVENKQLAILAACLVLLNIFNMVCNIYTGLPIGINIVCAAVILAHLYMLRLSLKNIATERSKFRYFLFLTTCLAIVWLLNNGLDSSMPMNFIFYLIAGLLTLSGTYRLKFIVFFIGVTIACLITDFFFPQYLIPYTDDKSKHFDLLTSFLVCVIISITMVSSYKNVYDYEKKILSLQKKKLEKSGEELIASNKIAEAATQSKSKFVMTMSHEIRTPLNGIIGTIDLLQTTPLNNHQQLLLENLQASSHILFELVADLLDISRIEANKMKIHSSTFCLKSAVSAVERVLEPMLKGKDLQLSTVMEEDMPQYITTDEARFKQILLNILSNAIQFTEKGFVKVHLWTSAVAETSYLHCAVQDTGVGIKVEDIPHLFEQFSQIEQHVHLANKGVGLGLTICDKLLSTLNGTITVESIYGKGSTFTFKIPFSPADPKISTLGLTHEKNHHSMHKLKILIVEDNRINQLVLSKMLDELGYPHECADDGQQALDKLKEHYFNIVLMDIQMPIMNGVDSTHHILAHYAETGQKPPIIIGCSAHAMENDREKYLKEGMSDFIIKPISLGLLKETLGKLTTD
ncbi:ATP-binding protein [Sphingobacterium sp. SYP-B4668]|uniref:ATP-binding protein n=1 Tax=Sphingobacterium sp. SYP-B4668 TaxID=2996035 RepID=UPI0022DE0EF9|nr:ATP-binding protein [Sphingobacterium sp. SYP-B4668]